MNVNVELTEPLKWPAEGVSRVPFRVFSDPEIYQKEQRVLFHGKAWHFLCLEIDIPNAFDYRTTHVGETSIIVTRDEEKNVHAMVNRCAHKGAIVAFKERGNARTLSCVYHSWNYNLDGTLRGLAFQKGSRGEGGMPENFCPAQHRLQPLRVEIICGLVFGTFGDETPPLREFLGPTMVSNIERSLGRPYHLLGYHTQILHNNWKLYAENVRDPYHATLLHTFYTTFKINRLDMEDGLLLSDCGRHSYSYAKRNELSQDEEYDEREVHSAQFESRLEGPALLDSWLEFEDGITHSIQTVFPSLTIHFTLNSLAVRFFVPRGVDETELHWMYLGYDDDTAEQSAMRTMQGNLTGAAGLVSLEDGCINEFVQRGTRTSPDVNAFLEMGGTEVASSIGSRATETAIRGFWQGYRKIMGFE
ncbi:MAG: anthranilate 1,2-dioxygenase large subunit [Gammaproteobacteria bacterium]|jgi:anthranilate 1,2-dioxygenase large subunit